MADTIYGSNNEREQLVQVLGESIKSMLQANEATQVAILSFGAIAVANVATGQIPPRAMAAAISAMVSGRPDAEQMRGKVASFVTMLVGMSERLPAALEQANGPEPVAAAAPEKPAAKPSKGKKSE